jgi:hypothetical protein
VSPTRLHPAESLCRRCQRNPPERGHTVCRFCLDEKAAERRSARQRDRTARGLDARDPENPPYPLARRAYPRSVFVRGAERAVARSRQRALLRKLERQAREQAEASR